MSAPPPAAPAPPPRPTPPRPRRGLRALRRTVGSLLGGFVVLVALLAATVAWLVSTTAGLKTMIALASRFSPVTIEAKDTVGALTREFGFGELLIEVGGTRVQATELRVLLADWHWRPLRLTFDHLEARSLRVDLQKNKPPEPEPPSPPLQEIGLPFELAVDRLAIDELTLGLGESPVTISALQAKVALGPWGYRLQQTQLAYGPHKAKIEAELGGTRPFRLQADAALAAEVQDKAMQLNLQAKGSLVEMTVEGTLKGAGSSGSFSAQIASFDTPAVKSLQLDVTGVDPRVWAAAAPKADLAVKAQLTPNEAMNEVGGTVQVVNRAPGTIDEQRIPVRSARARIVASASELKVDRLLAELIQGTAQGDFAMQYGKGFAWQANARLSEVDPAKLHGKLQPLRVDGSVKARQEAETIFVLADLANRGRPAATLQADAQITPREATINTARLALGNGFVAASGVVGLQDAMKFAVKGELQRFEPGLLVKDVDASISGTFAADGALQPQPNGRVRFELADSRAWGRPLTATGRVDLDPAQRLDMDIDVGVRSARLQARGGLGAADRSLEVMLDVPVLAELLPSDPKAPIAGSLKFSAAASGAWTAPAVKASLTASGLRYADHSLKSLHTDVSYGGGADGALQVKAGLGEYAFRPQPKAAVSSVTLAVDGRLSEHGIRLQGTMKELQGAMLYAQGGWRGNAWRGRLDEVRIGAPVDLRLLLPANLVIGPKFEFGPAQLALRHLRFESVRFSADEGRMATSGNFSGLQPTRLVPPVEGAMAPVIAPVGDRTPLTLRGEWDLRLGAQLNGRVLIERSGGDLYAGRGADSALKLVDLRLEATVEANELAALARIESAQKGGLGASLQAKLENAPEAGWRLAQKQPWLIIGAFDLPTMDWINALASDHIRANIRLGGRLNGSVRVEGTPGDPKANGRLSGDELRLAWVEQGMRLENGRLRAHVEDDLIVLDELHFSGPPRARPDDRRVAAVVKGDEDGSVDASGRLRLRDFSGLIQVAANKLPLLQRPDRFIVASGGANIEISAKHVQLNGAVAAGAGFVDFSQSELPSLSSDVVVVRVKEPVETRERRFTFGFDLGIDLGPAFYVRGSGLDTRVEGAVRLRSAGRGTISAVGSIATVDGVYEGFGQKLKIARGRLNFQGAPENPGLDILAIRPGLPVEVGVTITRTAANPLVRLYSDPPMPDVEALSWLVVGRPADQSKGDNLALAQAAAGLLGGSGEGYTTRITRSLGIDEFSIRSGQIGAASLLPSRSVAGSLRSDEASTTTVAGEIITIGKRLNDALSVSYEQAVSGTTRIVQLNYQLSSRLSAIARAGTDNAVDLVYTIAFD